MSQIKLGDTDIPFVFRGDELMYPNYVKDGLILHYDFSGMTNADTSRGIATDLSGNGNHGTLQNFNYTTESGYDKNKLLFDGADDWIINDDRFDNIFTQEITAVLKEADETITTLTSTYTHNGYISGFNIHLNSGRMRLEWGENGNRRIFTIPIDAFTLGSLCNVVATIDSGFAKVYINGKLVVNSETVGFDPVQQGVATGFFVGKYATSYDHYRLNSAVYSVKAYNRPLSPEEIAHNYAIEKERFGIE